MASSAEDERKTSVGLDFILARTTELNGIIDNLRAQMHRGPMDFNWFTMMDSLTVIRLKIRHLMSQVESSTMPDLHDKVFEPHAISRDRDENLENVTGKRIPALTHDVLPVLLRTKLIPELEEKDAGFEAKAAKMSNQEALDELERLKAAMKAASAVLSEHSRAFTASGSASQSAAEREWKAERESQKRAKQASLTKLLAALENGDGLK